MKKTLNLIFWLSVGLILIGLIPFAVMLIFKYFYWAWKIVM
jgi:hypothetical protein